MTTINRARVGAWVEDRMAYTAKIERPATVDVDRDAAVDTGTLVVTHADPTDVVADTPCSVKPVQERADTGTNDAGQPDGTARVVIGFPFTTGGVDVLAGDRVTILTAPTADAEYVGRVFAVGRIRATSRKVRTVVDAAEVRP